MAAVAARRGERPEPGRPVPRPLHLRRDGAAALAAGESALGRRRPPRARSRERSGSTCSTPRCSPPAPRPSSTRASGACSPTCRTTSRASCRAPRLVGHLLEGEGVTRRRRDGLVRPATARCGALGAVKLLGDAPTPLAERPIKVADRLAAHLLGARMDELPAPVAAAARADCPPTTRAATSTSPRSRAMLAPPERPAGRAVRARTPRRCWRKAYGRPLVVAHVRDMEQRDVMADAALISALEGRPLVFEGLEDLDPAERGAAAARDRAARASGPSSPRRPRGAALALGDRTVLLVEAPPPTYARAPARRGRTSPASHDDRRRGRQVPALDGPDRRGGRGRAPGRRRRAATRRRRPPTSTSAPARRPPPGSASWPRGSRPATAGRTSWCPSASSSCCSRSPPTCATATACSPTGATSARSPAPRA